MVLPSEWPPYTCLGFCAEAPEAVAAPGPRGRGRAAADGAALTQRGVRRARARERVLRGPPTCGARGAWQRAQSPSEGLGDGPPSAPR